MRGYIKGKPFDLLWRNNSPVVDQPMASDSPGFEQDGSNPGIFLDFVTDVVTGHRAWLAGMLISLK